MASPASTSDPRAIEIPDYVGHYLDVAFTHAVQRHLGIPRLVDMHGRRLRITSLGDWKVVRQAGETGSMVFEVRASR